MANIIPVVLSGGSGSRLWPLSRAMRPKQFLGVTEEHTLFQRTLERVNQLDGALAPIIVANHEHRFLAAEQARSAGVDAAHILLEPLGRNTAPAIAVAALQANTQHHDPLLLVTPSDHIIEDTAVFAESVALAAEAAADGLLLTFGIVPDRAETGYGYVMTGEDLKYPGVRRVARFVEKPDLATAEQYVASGQYFWNSGMFMFRTSVFLEELEKYRPDILAAAEKSWSQAHKDLDFIRLDRTLFAACPAESVDYAVMEQTTKAAMVALDAGWNDVGAWPAVWQSQAKDVSGNAARGDAMFEAARHCYVHADHRLVVLLGTEDLFVIETSDAVLVGHKDHAQDVKKVVERLQTNKRKETDLHREVFRPWGSFDSIDQGSKYQVKRITVAPGAKLSLQYHHHRAEHWIVVSGTAKVRIGERTQLLAENQSIYIPIGETHSLENPGNIPLELIEVQSGSYLGEDDIVRLEDIYGRA